MRFINKHRTHIVTAIISIVTGISIAALTGASKPIGAFFAKPIHNEERSKKNLVRYDSLRAVFSQHKHIEYAPLVKVQKIEDNSIAVAVISSKVRSVDEKLDLVLDHILDLQKTIRYSQMMDSIDRSVCEVHIDDTVKDAIVVVVK